jgi:bifunctional non-homologous end joining protein LigD
MAKKTLPEFIPPMIAESAKAVFDRPDWIFEIKLDGYWAITVFDSAGKPHLWSRNGLSLEAKFPAIAKAVSKLKLCSTVLDGEIVAVDENGTPRFQLLQSFQSNRRRRATSRLGFSDRIYAPPFDKFEWETRKKE